MSETRQLSRSFESRARTSRLVSAGALMAAGTALSRLLGFGRLMLLVLLFGNATRQADMFAIANTVPNSMYILLAGGVLNSVLVPQIVRAIQSDPDRGEAYTNRIMTLGLVALGVITVALTFAVPLIIRLYSASGWRDPAVATQYQSMIALGYYCMPQVFFYGVHVLAGQVLNARDRFGPMMWAPIANNVVSIGVLLSFWGVFGRTDPGAPFTPAQELLLGLGSTLGIAVQAAVLVPFLRAAGYRFHPRFDFAHTGLGKTVRLAKWTLGFVIVLQVALVVVNRLASGATVGGSGAGLAAYSYAYAVWILPHSLITVSLATAMLPAASRLAAAADLAGVGEETLRTMRLAMTALLPAAVAFLALGLPIARLVFGFGRGGRDADYVGWALMALAVGLVPFTLQYICLRAFYALEDTRTPFFLQLVISAANVALAVSIVLLLDNPALVATGLAAAYAGAYVLGFGISLARLKRRLPGFAGGSLVSLGIRLLAAATPAAMVAFGICVAFAGWSATQPARLLGLAAAGLGAVAVFVLLGRLLHIEEVTLILRVLLRRSPAPAPGSPTRNGAASSTFSPTIESGPAGPATGEPTGPDETTETMPSQAGDPSSARTTPLPRPASLQPPEDETAVLPPVDVAAPPADFAAATLPAGTVLGDRYQLEELLTQSPPAVTWRALDRVLSRSVLVHLLPPGDAGAAALLAAARSASVATDSRFLRVLDAVPSSDAELGSYIVCEYATGQSLELILSRGPLSGLEAAWVIREVADAMAGVHSLGLYHERLNPDTVIITPAGNVKIVGLLIEAALRPRPDPSPAALAGPEQVDVVDLGRLLYAALVCRWPGGPAYGLPDAPGNGQQWLTPRQVRAGVPPALDLLCDQLLGDSPRQRAPRITSASRLVGALNRILGPVDASADLERRLRQPIPRVGQLDDTPVSPLLPHPPNPLRRFGRNGSRSGRSEPVDGGASGSSRGQLLGGDTRDTERTLAAASLRPSVRATVPESTETVAVPASPATRPGAVALDPSTPRRGLVVLAAVTVLLLGLGVAAGVTLSRGSDAARPGASGPASSSAAPAPGPASLTAVPVVRAADFDPEGNPNSENPDEVDLAVDGNSQTRWRTLTYFNNPRLGGLKSGVGLILDLGSAQPVRAVRVGLSGSGTDLEVRVPREAADTVTAPPRNSAKAWRTVTEDKSAQQTADLSLAAPVPTRFVLVWLTSLPKEGKGYRGGIYEVQVFR